MFSEDSIRVIRPTKVRQEISDNSGGLTLVVQPIRADGKPSAKAFIWRGRINGQIRKITIGRAEAMKVTAARTKSFEITNAVRAGRDPYQEMLDARLVEAEEVADVITLDVAFEAYMTAEGGKRKSGDEKRAYYDRDVKPTLGAKAVTDVTFDDLAKLVNAKAVTSPIAANRLTSMLSRFFKWSTSSKGRYLTGITINPMTGIEKPAEEGYERDRFLSASEIRWFLAGCRAIRTTPRQKGKKAPATGRWAVGLEVLLRTGQRKTDVIGLDDAELDFDAQTATLAPERHKSGARHVFYMTNQVVALLRGVSRPNAHSATVFQAMGSTETNLNRIRRAMEALAAKEGKTVPHWTIHDLRRTCASTLSDMPDGDERPVASTDEIKKVLGHKLQGAIGHYLHGDAIPTKRRVMRIWNEYLDGLLQPVKLARAA